MLGMGGVLLSCLTALLFKCPIFFMDNKKEKASSQKSFKLFWHTIAHGIILRKSGLKGLCFLL